MGNEALPEFPLDETVKEFLRAVHRGQRGLLEIRCITRYSTGQSKIRSFFFESVDDVDETKILVLNAKGANINFGVALRMRQRGRREDIAHVGSVWVDLDGKDFDQSVNRGKELARNAIDRLSGELKPSILVDSGNGFHLYWLLAAPVDVTKSEGRTQIEAVNRDLARLLGGDNVGDVSRVLRLPGTNNVKEYYNRKPCKILLADYSRRFLLSDFEHLKQATPTPAVPIPKFNASLPVVSLEKLRVNPWAIDLIRNGWRPCGRYKSRSEADMAIVNALVAGGHTDDEIRAIFSNPDWRIGSKYRGEPK